MDFVENEVQGDGFDGAGGLGGDEGYVDPPAYDEGETQEWTGPSQEEWQGQQQVIAQMAAYIEHLSAGEEEEGYEDEGEYEQQGYEQGYEQEEPVHPVQQYLEGIVDEMVEERMEEALAPFDNVLGSVAEERGEQIANQYLNQMEQQIGPFDHTQAVLLADSFASQGYDPIQSLQTAAQMVSQYEKQLRETAISAYRENMGRVASAGEPGAGGYAANQIDGVPEGESPYRVAAMRVLARRRPGHPAG